MIPFSILITYGTASQCLVIYFLTNHPAYISKYKIQTAKIQSHYTHVGIDSHSIHQITLYSVQ